MSLSQPSSGRRLTVAVALLFLVSYAIGADWEYFPPVEWSEPPVVTPGATDDEPPSDALVLFDGTDLSAWENADHWRVEDGVAISGPGRLTTKAFFGDCQLHIEWSAPTAVEGVGQGRGNSGIHLMGVYEVQILDSYQNPTYPDGQAAAIYKQVPPMVNAMRPPGEWNTYDIFWKAPRFDENQLIEPAVVSVVHNGLLVIDRHVVTGETGWHTEPRYRNNGPRGPVTLQYHGDAVCFRNIWLRELRPPHGKPRPAKYIDHATGATLMADVTGEPLLNRRATAELDEVRDIDYVGDGNPRHRLHLYLPANRDRTRPLPIVCYIHGGGWRSGEMEPANLVRALAEDGRYGAATISYRLSGEAIWPAQIHDCKAAIRWLHANAAQYGLDPDRIGLWGISAGGHLATMLGVTHDQMSLEGDLGTHLDMPSRVACVVDWYGPTDLLAMDSQGCDSEGTHPDSLPSLLVGGPLNERIAASRSASPIIYASTDDAPLLLVHGTRDPLVPFEQSVEMFHAMKASGGTAAMVAVQGAGHGGLGDRVTEICHQFLESQLADGEFEMTYLSVPGPEWSRTHPPRQADTP